MLVKKIKILFRTILAILTFLSYSEDIVRESKHRIVFRLVARWYSPIFWIVALFMFVGTFMLGGFYGAGRLVDILKNQFNKKKPVTQILTPFKVTKFDRFLLINS
tara:strand:- start:747 stop:1061 length:315 start_codon:yes stop_codon:yes gene_type:complete